MSTRSVLAVTATCVCALLLVVLGYRIGLIFLDANTLGLIVFPSIALVLTAMGVILFFTKRHPSEVPPS